MKFSIMVFTSFITVVMAGPKPSYGMCGYVLVWPREPGPCEGCVSFLLFCQIGKNEELMLKF
jgi:hypothetical protein